MFYNELWQQYHFGEKLCGNGKAAIIATAPPLAMNANISMQRFLCNYMNISG